MIEPWDHSFLKVESKWWPNERDRDKQLIEFGREPWGLAGREYKGSQTGGEDVQHWRH